jgi:3-oxoacyl-[acyl-carrier protein] reductase/pteridine reductase
LNFAEKGWDVAINYNTSENMAMKTMNDCESFGVNANIYQADVSNKTAIIKMFDRIIKEMGKPDVLVNNAGIFPKRTKIEDITEELIDNTFAINLKGEFFTTQYFSQLCKTGSRIVNIASLGAYEVWNGRLPYHVSKSALAHMTKVMSVELAPNISVNCVSPGAIKIPDEPDDDSSLISIDKIPMERYGNVKDIFDAVYFFSTASNYITGQTLIVDGGYHNKR